MGKKFFVNAKLQILIRIKEILEKRPLIENNLNFFIRYNQSISIIRKVLKFDEKKN